MRPVKSISSSLGCLAFRLLVMPISAIRLPWTRMAPSVKIDREGSTVTIVACVKSISAGKRGDEMGWEALPKFKEWRQSRSMR